MSGAGPAADAEGYVYLTTSNGTFDLDQPGHKDAGNSFVKLNTHNGLTLSDYFTPFNQKCLDGRDEDIGAGGVLLLPEQPHTAHPHILVGVGKEGRIYVIDHDHMGQFHGNLGALQCSTNAETRTDIDQSMQELPSMSAGGFFGIPGYWAGTAKSGQLVYIGEAGDHLLHRCRPIAHSWQSRPNSRGFRKSHQLTSKGVPACFDLYRYVFLRWYYIEGHRDSRGTGPYDRGQSRRYDLLSPLRQVCGGELYEAVLVRAILHLHQYLHRGHLNTSG